MNDSITFTRDEVKAHEAAIERLRYQVRDLTWEVKHLRSIKLPPPSIDCAVAFNHWFGMPVEQDMDIQTEVAWEHWQIAWNAAIKSDVGIPISGASTQPATRDGGCLMCGHCAATGEPVANPMANQAQSRSSPMECAHDWNNVDSDGSIWPLADSLCRRCGSRKGDVGVRNISLPDGRVRHNVGSDNLSDEDRAAMKAKP